MSYNLPDIPQYDFTPHVEECHWKIKDIQKTQVWYKAFNITQCPECGAEVQHEI